jgi:plasmid stabilization system protein ParE
VNLPLIVNPEAEADLNEAWRWYEAERVDLGNDLIAAVDAVLSRIARAPRLYAKVFDELRLALVRRFPYAVVHRIDDDQITVVAVYHTHRDPRGWQSRT